MAKTTFRRDQLSSRVKQPVEFSGRGGLASRHDGRHPSSESLEARPPGCFRQLWLEVLSGDQRADQDRQKPPKPLAPGRLRKKRPRPSSRHFLSSVSLVLGDHHHHSHSQQQSQDLHHRLAETGAACQQLREHRYRGDVDEASGGEGQDPGGGGRASALRQQRADRPGHGPHSRQQLEENGLMGNRKRIPR